MVAAVRPLGCGLEVALHVPATLASRDSCSAATLAAPGAWRPSMAMAVLVTAHKYLAAVHHKLAERRRPLAVHRPQTRKRLPFLHHKPALLVASMLAGTRLLQCRHTHVLAAVAAVAPCYAFLVRPAPALCPGPAFLPTLFFLPHLSLLPPLAAHPRVVAVVAADAEEKRDSMWHQQWCPWKPRAKAAEKALLLAILAAGANWTDVAILLNPTLASAARIDLARA